MKTKLSFSLVSIRETRMTCSKFVMIASAQVPGDQRTIQQFA